MAYARASRYLPCVAKVLLLLAAGVALMAIGVLMVMGGHVQFGHGGYLTSSGGSAIALGLVLIVFAIADWRYRRRNAKGSRGKKRAGDVIGASRP